MIADQARRDGFIRDLIAKNVKQIDLVAATIWAAVSPDDPSGVSLDEVCGFLERNGTAALNKTRIRQNMAGRRFVRSREGAYRISPKERKRLDEEYSSFKIAPPLPDSGSVLPSEIFSGAKRYTQSVVRQINLSYDSRLFDCCAVMCRRLFETLIIESFEQQNSLDEIKGSDGEIVQLSRLIAALENTKSFTIGRQTKQAAKKLKDIGDWSAHNRRHNAVANDIDRVRDSLRVACGDLLHLAGQS